VATLDRVVTLSMDSERPEEYWGVVLGDLQKALARNGIQSEMRYNRGLEAGLRAVAQGEIDVGCNFKELLSWFHDGLWQPAWPSLRALMRVTAPRYIGVAATVESGITSLEQIAVERRPIRLVTISQAKPRTPGQAYVTSRILELSGFTQADVVAWGGRVFTGDDAIPAVMQGNVDVLAAWAYPNWAPNWGAAWMYGQILLNLRFLPIAEHVLDTIGGELGVRKGMMPAHLFRGLEEDVPTLVYPDEVINTHADLSDDLAREIVRAIDEHQDTLQDGYVTFAYNPFTAWRDLGAPLHPGAEAYFRERGYMR
jgi:TRAP-type uncharacterized transport system substrate-binding protein